MNSSDKIYDILTRLMKEKTGQQLVSNRHWRIEMALKPVLRKHSIPDFDMLCTLIDGGADNALARECVEAIINNETCFFRDQANFALLCGPVIDALREKRKNTRRLRIWSAACSSGQEAYSMAISFAENREKWAGWDIQIFATDISRRALDQAKTATYSQFEVQRGLPVTLMLKYFDQNGEQWDLKKNIRDMVSFSEHNQIEQARHLSEFDLILCRNLLMYLTPENKQRVLGNLRQSIKPDGYLMLGAAETVIGHTEDFVTSAEFRGLYEPNKGVQSHDNMRLSA